MENRVALIGIVVENFEEVARLNEVLHEYADYIIGRMGLPYKKRGVSIISVAIDAPGDIINALSGKIGKLSGVTSKTVYAKLDEE
ncbi:MAG: iron-only hydrogenase system regulator [Clostridia bacterium]|nr:iron-only hydrogenase system regulator [Clostridia bacterium]